MEKDASRKEEAIAWKEKADQESGLGKYHEYDGEYAEADDEIDDIEARDCSKRRK